MASLFDTVAGYFKNNPAGTKEQTVEKIVKKQEIDPALLQILQSKLQTPPAEQQTKGGFAPADIPVDEDLYRLMRARTLPSMEGRSKNIAELANLVDVPEPELTGQDKIIRGLMGLSDIYSGTKNVPALYQEYLGRRDKKLKERELLDQVYSRMTPDEINFYKSNFQNMAAMSKDDLAKFIAENKAKAEAGKAETEIIKTLLGVGPETIEKQGAEQSNKPPEGKKKGSGGKKDASEKLITELSNMGEVPNAVLDLGKAWDKYAKPLQGDSLKAKGEQALSKIGGKLTLDTNAKAYDAAAVHMVQELTKLYEGGRMTDEDRRYVRSSTPLFTDSEKLKNEKIQKLYKWAVDKYNTHVKNQSALRGLGRIKPINAPPMQDERANALKWIKNNPKDPRVPAIKKKLGL
jgi:hypothetical protein